MNYTEGEWKVEKWFVGHGFNIFSETGGFVASVPMNLGMEHTMMEAEANAHLIAASKEMYEVLEALYDSDLLEKHYEYINRGIGTNTKNGVILVNLKKALAKAEGRQP